MTYNANTTTSFLTDLQNSFDINVLLQQLPGAVFIKQLSANDTHYLWANRFFANMLGYESENQVIGCSESAIPLLAPITEIFRAYDNETMQHGEATFLNVGDYHIDDVTALLVKKKPLADPAGKITSLLAIATPISTGVMKQSHFLNELHANKNVPLNVYRFASEYSSIGLTERESQCLYYFLHGKSAKEIAQLLFISNKTVESHIEKVKTKIGVSKKAELYDFAIANNLLKILPWPIFNRHTN